MSDGRVRVVAGRVHAGEGDPPGGRRALAGVLRAQAAVLDRLLTAVVHEYEQELTRAVRSPRQHRTEHIRRLLQEHDTAGTADAVAGVAGVELDYDLQRWHLGIIATGAGATQTLQSLAEGTDRRLLSVPHGSGSVWAWLGGAHKPTLTEIERGIQSAAGEPVILAVGEPARGLRGWRLTHEQAQAAHAVALRRNRIPRNRSPPARGAVTLTRYADVALLAGALKDQALARALVEIYLTPLKDAEHGGAVLRETLRAYLAAERNASSAAAALGVTRRTVANRLGRIEERLGRTLHPCPAELEVALAIDELMTGAAADDRSVGSDPV